jgi:NagD protein
MDGEINKGFTLIPGAKVFVYKLIRRKHRFLFLTNNSYFTAGELRNKLAEMGIEVDAENFYTSAMATASFIKHQMPSATAYVIGGKGLKCELEKVGVRLTTKNPDYVIVGETEEYDYGRITEATLLIEGGAKFLVLIPTLPGQLHAGRFLPAGLLLLQLKGYACQAVFSRETEPVMMFWARKKLKVHTRNHS